MSNNKYNPEDFESIELGEGSHSTEANPMLQVTVDVFCGRPNPAWILGDEEARSLLDEISNDREVIASAESGYQGLGYRGVLVEILSDDLKEEYDIPTGFKIGNGASGNEPKGLDIAAQLVNNMLDHQSLDESQAAAAPADRDLQSLLLEQIAAFPGIVSAGIEPSAILTELDGKKSEPVAKAATCYYELAKYNPGFWNNASVQPRNNCYNYATNRRTDTFAQPGRATGKYPYPMACDRVTNAALSDGAHKRYNCFPDSEKSRYLIALAVWPGTDYHWYRKHSEGFWGHKPGGTAARNTDNKGKIILDPINADRGPYTKFCGYFYTCKSMKVK